MLLAAGCAANGVLYHDYQAIDNVELTEKKCFYFTGQCHNLLAVVKTVSSSLTIWAELFPSLFFLLPISETLFLT